MKLRTFLAASTAIGLTSLIAAAGYNSRQTDTGSFCLQETTGAAITDRWCLAANGVVDWAPGTTADSAATNDMMEITMDTPVDTTGTNTHNALTLDIGIGNATGGTNAARGLQIDAIAGDAQVSTTGINIGAMTATAATEIAINIGATWDHGIATASGITLDDGTTHSPTITFQDATDETAVFEKEDAEVLTLTTPAGDGLEIRTGNLFVGNGTPGETINGEDLYVEGLSEFDGTANFDGAVDFDGTITIDSTLIAEEILKFPGRGRFTVCGDIATVNANTVYYGPSQAVIDSATAGMITCNTDAAGNTTEATADEPVLTADAIYPLGMVCYMTDMGATGSPLTLTLRSAGAAYMSGTITMDIADNELSNAVSVVGTTAIASGATVAVALTSAGDVGAGAFICQVEYAF